MKNSRYSWLDKKRWIEDINHVKETARRLVKPGDHAHAKTICHGEEPIPQSRNGCHRGRPVPKYRQDDRDLAITTIGIEITRKGSSARFPVQLSHNFDELARHHCDLDVSQSILRVTGTF